MPQSLRIAYAGTPEFAVPALKSIEYSQHQLICVLTQPDRKAGRGRKFVKSAVKSSITSEKMQILQPENVNMQDTVEELRRLKLDLIVVAAYGQIFSQPLLDIPRLGCINIHASLLPRWRGASPIQHAILAGDNSTGVTIMQMVKKMDAGDIWQQSSCEIDVHDTAETLHDKLAKLGGEVILPTIRNISENLITPTRQQEQQVTYCNKLNKSDGLIDWQQTANTIVRRIRAYHPWPGAYTYLNGRRIRITCAQVGNESGEHRSPGSICEISKDGFSVATNNANTVKVFQLVPEGGKLVSAQDFSNSNQLMRQKFTTTP